MSWQIVNNGASINVIGETAEVLLFKHKIKRISVVNAIKVRIDMHAPSRNVFFSYFDVTQPVSNSAVQLAAFINAMITDCVCHNCDDNGGSGD